MSKFNVGDKVKIRNDEMDMDNQSWLSDLDADLQCDLADRSVTGRQYDFIWKIISEGLSVVITRFVDGEGDPHYEVRRGKVDFSYIIPENQLEPIMKKSITVGTCVKLGRLAGYVTSIMGQKA